jgi:hypothetical protein
MHESNADERLLKVLDDSEYNAHTPISRDSYAHQRRHANCEHGPAHYAP